jgi:outer membrane receptor protein involved in Fe transport
MQSTRERLLASTMICGVALAALAASPSYAQSASGTEVKEVVVTGSRIKRPNLTSESPVTSVNSQEMKLSGATGVEQVLNNLPQAFADQSNTFANGATGTATVNLRNLGAVRTLVLVDGKRLMPGDPTYPVADLNVIPAGLVDRVDVLTGGASAVYGSDAIGGVVNFIMKKNFEGIQLDYQYGWSQHKNDDSAVRDALAAMRSTSRNPSNWTAPADNVSDGFTHDVSILAGVNSADGKGNITFYGGYRSVDPVMAGSRDYAACPLASDFSGGYFCAGSSNSFYGRFISANPGPHLGTKYTTNPSGDFMGYSGARDSYNFAPLNYLQRPDQRYTAGATARYEVNSHIEAYSSFMFADDHTVAQIAPSGLFQGSGPLGGNYSFNCNNPLAQGGAMSAAQLFCTDQGLAATDDAQLLIGRRFVENGPRQDDLRHTAYRFVLGARGDINDTWSYDVYGQYGSTIYNERYLNDASAIRVQNALHVVTDTRPGSPTNGQPVCMSVILGTDLACAPLDIFHTGAVSRAAADYIRANGSKQGETNEQIVSGTITGDLGNYGVRMPWAKDGVGIAVGAEYRREFIQNNSSSEFESGDLTGQGGPTPSITGSFDVKELFGEARIPVIQDMQFAKSLELDLGYRVSDYSTAGTTNTYKVAGDWAPNDDVRFRASFQRAVRAPNVLELFTPQAVALFGGADPCAGSSPGLSFAQCAATGVTLAQYGNIPDCPAAQCSQLLAGNPDLKPETSDTRSIGVVFTPTFFRGFNASVDYFDIQVQDLIGSTGAGVAMAECVGGFAGDPLGNTNYCSMISRAPGSGALFGNAGYVEQITTNTGGLRTKGFDVSAAYRLRFADIGMDGLGSLDFNFDGTLLKNYQVTPGTGAFATGTYDCAGYFGAYCGAPLPKWRHKARLTWNTPWKANVSLNWRHIGSSKVDINETSPMFKFLNIYYGCSGSASCNDAPDAKLKKANYFDLSGTWSVRDNVTLRAGVSNIFDKNPQIIDAQGFGLTLNANTYPGVYDTLGRTFFVGLTTNF